MAIKDRMVVSQVEWEGVNPNWKQRAVWYREMRRWNVQAWSKLAQVWVSMLWVDMDIFAARYQVS